MDSFWGADNLAALCQRFLPRCRVLDDEVARILSYLTHSDDRPQPLDPSASSVARTIVVEDTPSPSSASVGAWSKADERLLVLCLKQDSVRQKGSEKRKGTCRGWGRGLWC